MRGWIGNVVVIVAVVLFGMWLRARTATAEDALCVLRGVQVEAQVADRESQRRARAYLADVKAGRRARIAGITDRDIQDSIDARARTIFNRERSIQALSLLHC